MIRFETDTTKGLIGCELTAIGDYSWPYIIQINTLREIRFVS